MQLYDQKAHVSDAEEVNCTDCSTDAVVSKLKEAVSDLLDRCAGSQCAQAVLSGAVQAPVAACEPFPVDACSSPELDSVLASASPPPTGASLDPKTANLIKGLTWGAFAASAVTGITLLALSGSSAGSYQSSSGLPVTHNLDGPGLTAIGIAGVLLGVSIPTTIVVDRAASRGGPRRIASSSSLPIQCPN